MPEVGVNLLGSWLARMTNRTALSRPAGSARLPLSEPLSVATEGPPVDPIDLRQKIWGEGFVLPGGTAGIMRLVLPFGLDSSMSVCDFAAGLGGPARHVAKTFNLYINAYERLQEMARRGQAMSIADNMKRRAPVAAFDPETIELKPRRFDAVYLQHLTWAVEDKARLFGEIRKSLKARGQIILVEPTVTDAAALDPRVFRALGDDIPRPWPVSDYVACLRDNRLDARVVQDDSGVFRSDVLLGWQAFLAGIDKHRITKRELFAVMAEAERWFILLQAIDQGRIAITRFQAFAK